MKLLLDACVWPGAAAELAPHGHDVLWAGNFPGDPSDDELLAFALNEGRVVVTLDKDFGELAVAFGRPHAGIIRIVHFPISKHAVVCLSALERHGDELALGAIVTAEPGRLRLRPPSATMILRTRED
jgi:predicted nuclease of predicted toxin-antitoxin system